MLKLILSLCLFTSLSSYGSSLLIPVDPDPNFNNRDGLPLTNPDGKIIKYCEPYLVQQFFGYESGKYYNFSTEISGYDFISATPKISEAKTLIIEPKFDSEFICKDMKLVDKNTGILSSTNTIDNNAFVLIKFMKPTHSNYQYLAKSKNKYYYLNNEPISVSIADFQTRSFLYAINPITDTPWAGETKQSVFTFRAKSISFISNISK